ncbi:hypothetical protein [Rhodoplanes roseus]|uniref:Uncharacterized protein n=1 Tax=Rhodoplanes roseus TaxID=29409 RepID=A0A327KYI0_9BRAD|nr:hypothetical protein [Rhodoplanes roseus]RAI43950.1 hypothetical protein CH341_11555 [Rhodoplanes roseus]
MIAPADLRRFVLDHLDRIDLRKVDKIAFVALIAGEAEPAATHAAAPSAPPEKLEGAMVMITVDGLGEILVPARVLGRGAGSCRNYSRGE